MDFEGIEANYIAGTPYLGADILMFPGPGGYRGEVIGWDMATQRRVWAVREPFPVNGGMLVTSGDLLFYGTMDGWFKALDARTGAELWRFKLASGVVANPITYVGPDGRQYVAVYAGIGGWLGTPAYPFISADDPTSALGVTGATGDLKQVTAPASILYIFGL
jgi:glucose dehydrogenase